MAILLQLEEENKKEKEEEKGVAWREGRKRKKMREVLAGIEKKKNERNVVYLGLCYFGAIF